MNWQYLMTDVHFWTAIIGFWCLVVIKSFTHHYMIVIDKTDPHKGQARVLGWIFNGMGMFVSAMAFPMNYTDPDFKMFGAVITIIAFQWLWHTVIFAPLLNKLRKLGFTYLGKNSMGFDKYFINKPKYYAVFYGLICILAILSVMGLHQIFRP